MKKLLVLILYIVTAGCSGSGSFYRVSAGFADSTQIKVGLLLDKAVYDRSETIVAYVFLRNESRNVLFLNARFAGDFLDREGEEITFEVDPDPRYYFRRGEYPDLSTRHVQILYPGEKVTCVSGFVLANDAGKAPFKFPPGKYRLRAVYKNVYQSKAYGLWAGKVKSEPFEFEVR